MLEEVTPTLKHYAQNVVLPASQIATASQIKQRLQFQATSQNN